MTMTCWKLWCRRKFTKSECREALGKLRKRIFSRVTSFKITQLAEFSFEVKYNGVIFLKKFTKVLASGGMSFHVCQPFYRTLADSSLVPGVLGAFIVVSGVLLVGHLLNFTAPTRLNVTFSIVASIGYGWCMSSVMDSLSHRDDTTSWTCLLGKGIVCFIALAIHLAELLHAFITRDERPVSLRSGAPSQPISRTESFHPVQTAI